MAKENGIADAINLLHRAIEMLEQCLGTEADNSGHGLSAKAESLAMDSTMKTAPQQQDLFTEAQFEAARKAVERKCAAAREKAKAKAAVRKRGTPGIGKAQALKNFREIAGTKELLTLAEVNRIFGYNESTHGRFVKDAIKSGKLPDVKYGEKRKFVAREVRRFIDEYYRVA